MFFRNPICWASLLIAIQVVQGQEPAGSTTPVRSYTWVRNSDLDLKKSGCSIEHIDTSWGPNEKPPLELEDSSFMLTDIGTTYARVSIRNLAALPLQGLALVIEYADTQGQLLGIVPIVGATENLSSKFHVPFPFQRVTNPWQGVLPGTSVTLQGKSDGIWSPECPRKAIITFAITQAADGSIQEFASPGWHLDPTPRVIPFVPVFPRELAHPPIGILARIRINASGQVTGVVAADNSDPRLVRILEEEMRNDWRFNPALYDGQPAASEVFALFRIHAEIS